MKKGDIVVFILTNNPYKYEVVSNEYEYLGRKVCHLKHYPGEVATEYLKKVGTVND